MKPAMRSYPEPISLAESPKGRTIEIVHILFDSLRRKYRELGLRRGVLARCHATSPMGVDLILEDGTRAVVDNDQARFIEIRVVDQAVAVDESADSDADTAAA